MVAGVVRAMTEVLGAREGSGEGGEGRSGQCGGLGASGGQKSKLSKLPQPHAIAGEWWIPGDSDGRFMR
jgi:hypothetical protein